MAMMETGMTQAEARKRIWMYDKYGLLVKVSVCVTDMNDQNILYVSVASCLAHCWGFYYIFIDLLLPSIYCLWV